MILMKLMALSCHWRALSGILCQISLMKMRLLRRLKQQRLLKAVLQKGLTRGIYGTSAFSFTRL